MQRFPLTLERIAEMKALLGDTDDETLVNDTLEGETDAFEWMDYFVGKVADEIAMRAAIKERVEMLRQRSAASDNREQRFRDALGVLIRATGQKSIRRPEASVSVWAKAPSVQIVDETLLPDDCVRVKREPDKAAIKDRLKAGEEVPGAALSNGGETLTIRFA